MVSTALQLTTPVSSLSTILAGPASLAILSILADSVIPAIHAIFAWPVSLTDTVEGVEQVTGPVISVFSLSFP